MNEQCSTSPAVPSDSPSTGCTAGGGGGWSCRTALPPYAVPPTGMSPGCAASGPTDAGKAIVCAGSAGSACGRFRAGSGSGVLPGLMRWRRHSRLVLSGRPTFTTWTGRAPAARGTCSVTVDPVSRRDKRPRGGVAGPDFKQGPAQFGKQPAVLLEPLRRRVEVVQRADVHRLEPGVGKPGEVGGVADKPLVGGRPR